MNFKLDENFGTRAQQIFADTDHGVKTVRDQGLQGSSDRKLYELCCSEKYCLVTLDLDFSDVTRFPPSNSSGIVVFRMPKNPSLPLFEQQARQFLQALKTSPIENNLWIVEARRIRIHQSEDSS